MSDSGARFFAAVFRSTGIDAQATPESNDETLELGGLYTSGEECYPSKVTMGDFLRIVHTDGFDPDKHAFFMPTANGPCRFGQYAPYLRTVLDKMGHKSIPIISPTSENGYDGLGDHSNSMVMNLWRGLICGDILRKLLLKTRPYETQAGATDEVYEKSMQLIEAALEKPNLSSAARFKMLIEEMHIAREMFREIPARYTRDKPLIGVVGEIFCRLNDFSNYDAIRKIEAHGGECWLSDISEWVWYTNWSHRSNLRREHRTISLEMLKTLIKNKIQRISEDKLLEPFRDDFVGYEEPHNVYKDVLKPAWKYLPADGALGEMVLSVGKAIYVYQKGADGIIDISPFSCMNGIVTEAVYHNVSKDYDDIPIRNFYFDASSSNMDRDLDIFMELAVGYAQRKQHQRVYPSFFEDA